MNSKINLCGHVVELIIVDTKSFAVFINDFETLSRAGIRVHNGNDVVPEFDSEIVLGSKLRTIINTVLADKSITTFMGCVDRVSKVVGFSPVDAEALRNIGYGMFLKAVSEERKREQRSDHTFDGDVETVMW